MWIWGIVWLWIVGLLIAALLIGLAWHTKGFSPWRDVSETDATAGPSKGTRALKPRTPDDCPACRGQLSWEAQITTVGRAIIPYTQVKSSHGRKKRLNTAGYACPNPSCAYFGVTNETIHAQVHCGSHGQHERIADLKCQACGRKVSVRYRTALYRLKTASARIALVLTALAEGVGVGVATRIFGHSEFTIQTWLTRSGMHAQALHERLLRGLHLGHVQLDEVRTAIRQGSQVVWVWIAIDARSKLIVALHIGPRTQEMAQVLVHTLKRVLTPGCVPFFTSDGLALYFYALTSHFGQWVQDVHARAHRWQVSAQLLYGQVKKHYRRGCIQRVEHRAMLGTSEQIQAALVSQGFTGTIQTAFVERFNGTLRHGVSTLVRRTGGKAQLLGELTLHLEWFRAYYSFVRPQSSLRAALEIPVLLPGRVQKYHQHTPAMVTGIGSRRWTVLELLSFPILPGPRPACVGCA
jgi:IS1 family transposase